jgi:hypothetical protein
MANVQIRLNRTGTLTSASNFDEITYNTTSPVITNLLRSTTGPTWGGPATAITTWQGYCAAGTATNMFNATTDVAAPNGSFTALKIVRDNVTSCGANSNAWGVSVGDSSGVITLGQTYTVSVWARTQSGSYTARLGINDSYDTAITITPTWQRFTYTSTVTDPAYTNRGLQIYCTAQNITYYIWGAQLEVGSTATAYQPINSAGNLDVVNFVSRINSSSYYISQAFDEWSGTPKVDSSLTLWLDAGQTASYPGSGTNWYDLSAYNNPAFIANGTFPTYNITNNALNVAQSPSTGTGPNSSLVSAAITPSFSLEVWCLNTSFSTGGPFNNLIALREWYQLQGYRFGFSTDAGQTIGYPTFWSNQSGGNFSLLSSISTAPNVYNQIVVTYDQPSQICRIYVNGVLAGTQTNAIVIPPTNPTSVFFGGNGSGCLSMIGQIAIIRQYNYAITVTDVLQNYTANYRRFGLPAVASTAPVVAKRETRAGTALVAATGEFDEYTGNPIRDSSLRMWLDAAQVASYPGSGLVWTNLTGNVSLNGTSYSGTGTSPGNVVYINNTTVPNFSYTSANAAGSIYDTFGFSVPVNPVPTTGSFTIMSTILRNPALQALGGRETIYSNAGSSDGYRFGYDSIGRPYYLIGASTKDPYYAGFQEGNLGSTNVATGQWRVLTIVYDRAAELGSYTVYGYVDGVLSGSVVIAGGAAANRPFTDTTAYVGSQGCCAPFAGQINNLMVYARALSAAEVLQNYYAMRRINNI